MPEADKSGADQPLAAQIHAFIPELADRAGQGLFLVILNGMGQAEAESHAV
ncbi:hypothetical protein OQ252_06580 [Acetobacter farinalis]|uniref:Uncharacterized protein n=1 Tax=Acetobacter farinalis TaxID=1260984 RepID=A0ABT3Q6Y3_9PROT|nr:hypothetical protein [Acetobacter farinalis]MCX2561063.1 hypothetical protein [Acetobacter farinalis]NHO29687.1 hypothetical protein [Acetobacter farinalis]